MASLLALPMEIRMYIIEYLIHSERKPAHDPCGTVQQVSSRTRSKRRLPCRNHHINYEAYANIPKPNALGLLLTNHQLHTETKACLRRNQNIFKVDVAIMHGRTLWPTFTCIGTRGYAIDVLEGTFHIAGDGPACRYRWCKGSGQRTLIGSFWSVFLQAMFFGPYNWRQYFKSDNVTYCWAQTIVRVLDINFTDPDDPTSRTPWYDARGVENAPPAETCKHCHEACSDIQHALHGRILKNFSAHRIYDHHSRFIQQKLEQVEFSFLDGDTIYTRIGKLRLRIRGVIVAEVDIGELLNIMPKFYESSETEWTARIREARNRHGLPCVEEEGKRLEQSEWVGYLKRSFDRKSVQIPRG